MLEHLEQQKKLTINQWKIFAAATLAIPVSWSRKPLVQPIGDMRETDRKLAAGRKHGRSPFDALVYHRATRRRVARREAGDEQPRIQVRSRAHHQ